MSPLDSRCKLTKCFCWCLVQDLSRLFVVGCQHLVRRLGFSLSVSLSFSLSLSLFLSLSLSLTLSFSLSFGRGMRGPRTGSRERHHSTAVRDNFHNIRYCDYALTQLAEPRYQRHRLGLLVFCPSVCCSSVWGVFFATSADPSSEDSARSDSEFDGVPLSSRQSESEGPFSASPQACVSQRVWSPG